MDVMQKILFLSVFAVSCLACKQLEESRLQTLDTPVRTAGIAVVYMGHERCRQYLQGRGRSEVEIARVVDRNRSFGRYITHLIVGDDGELITTEFRRERRNFKLQFSGDRFLRKKATTVVSMEEIESSCRRLLLRVDSAGMVPVLTLLGGTTRKRQQFKQFQVDFGGGYGEMLCGGDFCTFGEIRGATRYFSYLLPASSRQVRVRLRWCPQKDCERVHDEILTVDGISP